jgi:hypothetical protein
MRYNVSNAATARSGLPISNNTQLRRNRQRAILGNKHNAASQSINAASKPEKEGRVEKGEEEEEEETCLIKWRVA